MHCTKVEAEETVYEAVLAWLAYDAERRSCRMQELFSYVRLALLEEEYLDRCIFQVRSEGFS